MWKKYLLPVFLICFLTCPPEGSAQMRSIRKIRAGLPPFEVIKEVLRDNLKTGTTIKTPAPKTEEKSEESAVHLTWLADSDARIQPSHLLVSPGRKIHTIRNFGNQLDLATGAIDYGVRYLYSPVLLITGNTDSHAIRYFMEGYAELGPELRQELDHLHQPLAETGKKEKEGEESFEEQMLNNVERNVDYQVDLALERYGDRVANGRVVVIGSVLDLTDAYGRGPERLIIININGEKDDTRLKQLRLVSSLDSKLLSAIGRKRTGKPSPPPVPPQTQNDEAK